MHKDVLSVSCKQVPDLSPWHGFFASKTRSCNSDWCRFKTLNRNDYDTAGYQWRWNLPGTWIRVRSSSRTALSLPPQTHPESKHSKRFFINNPNAAQ